MEKNGRQPVRWTPYRLNQTADANPLTTISLHLRSFSLLTEKRQVGLWQLNSAGRSFKSEEGLGNDQTSSSGNVKLWIIVWKRAQWKLTKRCAKTLQHGSREIPGRGHLGNYVMPIGKVIIKASMYVRLVRITAQRECTKRKAIKEQIFIREKTTFCSINTANK